MSNKIEYPKHITATNEVTGALIKTRTDNQDQYAKGWDAIFGKGIEASAEDGISVAAFNEIVDTGFVEENKRCGNCFCNCNK